MFRDRPSASSPARASEPAADESARSRNVALPGAYLRSHGVALPVQAKAGAAATPAKVGGSVPDGYLRHYGISAGGSNPAHGKMPAPVQEKMERGLGADFSAVQIHEGPEAANMGARAFTRGTDVHFAPGQYDPHSQPGQELLGHELSHVVQQAQGRVAPGAQAKGGAVATDQSLEREADEMGARAARGERAREGASLVRPAANPAQPIQGFFWYGSRQLTDEEIDAISKFLELKHSDVQAEFDNKAAAMSDEGALTAWLKEKRIRVPVSKMTGTGRSPKTNTKRKRTDTQDDNKRDKKKQKKGDKKGEKKEQDDKTFKELLIGKLTDRGWHETGGGQSKVLMKTVEVKKGGFETKKRTKRAKIFQGSSNVVAPKQYGSLRSKQALRWMSTLALLYQNKNEKDPREVQSAIHDGKIYMSSNTSKSNSSLSQMSNGNTGIELMKTMLESVKRDWNDLSTREKQHLKKLEKRILTTRSDKTKRDRYQDVREALGEEIVIVTIGKNGLHAERRIFKHLKKEFNLSRLTPQMIGGVKRPCVSCFLELYDGQDIRPGLFWPSMGSNVEVKKFEEEDVEGMVTDLDKVPGTFVTRSGRDDEGKDDVRWDVDSESNSETDMGTHNDDSGSGEESGSEDSRSDSETEG